jgi:chromosome segregation ATPase
VVSGSNGSGKSAVLQAMQCALGAQARKTGRVDKNAKLVRTGCHEAKVQVRPSGVAAAATGVRAEAATQQ